MAKEPKLRTISVNLPAALVDRARSLGVSRNISVLSVVERSLEAFFLKDIRDNHAARPDNAQLTLQKQGTEVELREAVGRLPMLAGGPR
jgi:hypothetical protein